MSFTKTVGTVAALASVFGAAATGWKLAQDDNKQPNYYEERIKQLEEQLKQQSVQQSTVPQPVVLPQVGTQPTLEAPNIPPPPPVNNETTSR